MSQHLTLVYVTTRKDNRFQWFVDSLCDQLTSEDVERGLSIVLVNATHESSPFKTSDFNKIEGVEFIRTPPKPCIWQGPHRLTKENWFAASNARNTGLCFAPDGWIAYVDDLSVLMPHWLQSVRESMAGNYIAIGTYEKHNAMVVEGGRITYSKPYSMDSRWNHSHGDITVCGGDWLFGCSLAGPVQAFLDVNGWPETLCDGLGSEDYCMGICIGNTGRYQFRFDRRMKTIESEELHHVGEVFKKSDFGVSPKDKSHAALGTAKQSKWFPQYFGEGFPTISDLRQHVLNGGEFPIRKHPEHCWFTGTHLSEL